jgi:hypothetical protein
MNLSASESKRLEALRAKATLNAKEQSELDVLEAKLSDNTSHEVANPPAIKQIVRVATIKLRNDTDKPVLIELVEAIGNTDVLLLSAKQADALAESINIFQKGFDGWAIMKANVGNYRSEVAISVQPQKKGSSYVDRNGVIVIRDTDGINVLPQMFILPDEVQRRMDESAAKAIVKTWTSSARFLPTPAKQEVGAEE